MTNTSDLPVTCLPAWDLAELPEPKPLGLRNWAGFVGPGIVMMGIQIGGGEWLLGPEVTARYGGNLMWIATVAIVLQVFYNIECARYALYCGEPVMTGFLRKRPGPLFWVSVILFLNLSALIPALSTNAAAVMAGIWLDRPPGAEDRNLVTMLAYACLLIVAFPVLIGGKVYNMLQAVMTAKVVIVLGFCLAIGILFVSPLHWWNVMSGFARFGNVPVKIDGQDAIANVFTQMWSTGTWPMIELGNIAVLGAFAGYAGGGGLANSTYSNYVRDKGWGMGSQVGAIASAVGGRDITLSHLGKVFLITPDNLRKWKGWWRYILTDQILVWTPGCFMGMALPALLSLQFAAHSGLYNQADKLEWAQAMITADGIRHAPNLGPQLGGLLWTITLFVGLTVLLPSQMSIVEDFSRRWTDIIWSANRHARDNMRDDQVKYIYYTILFSYVLWTLVAAYLFSTYGTPKLMTLIIANLNNLALGVTAFQLLWVNTTLLPKPIQPRWYHKTGMVLCAVFYLGLSYLVFVTKQWPILKELLGIS
ncbi:Nramp family divalent metal transporter [Schlesneria sp.]|uniref:Nramp family divalent metal transporter n=1 Tax=Schlesneria sp. TaxID=2762018 RepID=UPI002F0115A1